MGIATDGFFRDPRVAAVAPGVTRLSELEIDADKDWQAKEIINLKAVAAAMARGDIVVRGLDVLERLIPGSIGHILTSGGPGHIPSWQPPGAALERFFPATIGLAFDRAIATVDRDHLIVAPLASLHRQAFGDAPADMIRQLAPTVTSTHALAAGIVPDQTATRDASVTRQYDLEIVVGGAVAEVGAVQTNETVAAQNTTVNDMTLLPAAPAVGNAYYFGHANRFNVMMLNLGTQGVGTWMIAWEYWNGVSWVALVGLTDGTIEFRAATGLREVSHTPQADWALTAILAMNLFWIRARVSAFTSMTARPWGTQAWIRIIT